MELDADSCYRALIARDDRFDGLFFVGVTTTGVYCRPVCPARTPRRERCRFFARAAQAEHDGFRACFRCRPELAPGNASIDAVARTVRAALARIDAGALNDASVDELAAELGTSGRHLRRALHDALGVTPIELAQTRRLLAAKQLLTDTGLPVTDVAFAAGFASVRRFNAAFRAHYGRSPSSLRRGASGGKSADEAADEVVVQLGFRPPLAWDALLAFLAPRATPGVEAVDGGVYRRVVALGGRAGWIAVGPPARAALPVAVSPALVPALVPLLARVRALFDLDAQPRAIAAELGRDPRLARALSLQPGVRVPGAFDGLELAVRAVLGQQVSVQAATTLAGRIAAALGTKVAAPGLERAAPTAEQLIAAGPEALARLGVVPARARTIVALARAVEDGLRLEPGADPAETVARLEALPGIGPWTAQVVAMRALRWPDAFPHGDLGIRCAFGGAPARAVLEAAERWRPWRAYAAMLLWVGRAEAAEGGDFERGAAERGGAPPPSRARRT
jgi:AraC family transcriptional regulator of adaptative response / DNA-3-methyladenine glycosylase II